MKLTAITLGGLAALTAPLSQAASVPLSELTTRQTKSRELIKPDLYPILQRYTRFAAASQGAFYYHDKICPHPPFKSSLIRVIESPTAPHASIYLFAEDASKELIFSFASLASGEKEPTSASLSPLTTSPGCTSCQVDTDILNMWNSLKPGVEHVLKELQPTHSSYKLILVGHSLGGSLSSLAYTELKSNGLPVGNIYTMGALRVGNQAYADFTDRLAGADDDHLGDLIRITHETDSMPDSPSSVKGFQQTRTEIYEKDTSERSDEQSGQTTFRCFGQEAVDCVKGNARAHSYSYHLKYTGVGMVDETECNNRR